MSTYRLIHAQKASFPIVMMCRLLKISRASYYAWVDRPASARSVRSQALTERITVLHKASDGVYGAPRLLVDLREEGVVVSGKVFAPLPSEGHLCRDTRVAAASVPEGTGMNHHDDHPEPSDATRGGPWEWSDEQLLLTAEQAARALHVGRTTLYALIKDGQLRAVHIGRSCRLTRAQLLRYVLRLDHPASRTGHPPAPTHPARPRPTTNQVGLFDLGPTPPDAA